MAYQLIRSDKELTIDLADKLNKITSNIASCKICGIYLDVEDTDKQINGKCHICIDQKKDPSKICVTESPADAYIIDESTDYNGYFFVLDGNLSPLDGRGPIEVGIQKLQKSLEERNIKELILATSTTVEGEATAHYVQQLATKMNIKVTRIAFGIPLNGELGYLDSETISHAFNERKTIL